MNFDQGFDFLGYMFSRSGVVRQKDGKILPAKAPVSPTQYSPSDHQNMIEKSDKSPRNDRGLAVLYLTNPQHTLSLRNESFSVLTEQGKEIMALAHTRVDRIEVSTGVSLTQSVLELCLESETDLVFEDGYGQTKGALYRN